MRIKMNYKSLGTFLMTGYLLLCFLPGSLWAETNQKAELMLQKRDPYNLACEWCAGLFSLKENDNRKDFRQYNENTQTGFYEIDVLGPAGTTVTLYGSQSYGLKHGYLILVKKDNRPIAVGELDHLPPRQWVDVNNEEGPGVYSVWYHPASYFKERIASVRWGQWWTELPPANEKE